MLKPFPPTTGTQSGIFILFKPLINVLIPSIIQFIGLLNMLAKPLTMLENICFIPSHA